MLGEQLLVGGHDRLAGVQCRQYVLAGGVGAAHQLDDDVGAGEDLLEVALGSGQDAAEFEALAGGAFDRSGAVIEQFGEGTADGAASEQAYLHRLTHTSRTSRSS